MNLLHYVAQQAEQTQPELLTVVEDLAVLEEASKWVLLCELNLESRHIRVHPSEKWRIFTQYYSSGHSM